MFYNKTFILFIFISKIVCNNVLLTGGSGYIGSAITYYLYKKKMKVFILDRSIHNKNVNLWANVIQGDFGNAKLVQYLISTYNIDLVIHLAATGNSRESQLNPIKCIEENVCKTNTFLDTIAKCKIKNIIYISSVAVYGGNKFLPREEDELLIPQSIYGESKLIVEKAIRQLSKVLNLNYVILRLFNASGAIVEKGINIHRHRFLIPSIIKAALTNQFFRLNGTSHPTKDGTCVRDYIHIYDIARGCYKAINFIKTNCSGIFNLGSGKGYSNKELINIFSHQINKKINIIESNSNTADPSFLIANIEKAKKELNWKPKYSDISLILKSSMESLYKKSIRGD